MVLEHAKETVVLTADGEEEDAWVTAARSATKRYLIATRYRFKNGIVWRPVALDPHATLSQCTHDS
jgi:hypothetical protein